MACQGKPLLSLPKEGSPIHRKWYLIIVAVVLLLYAALQAWVAYSPPMVNTGWGTLKVTTGQQVTVGMHLRNRGSFPSFSMTGVSVDPSVFQIQSVCAIRHENIAMFSGAAGLELPAEYASRCQPISEIRRSWSVEYALAMAGTVVTPPPPDQAQVKVTVRYRVLGWPHQVSFDPKLLEAKP